MGAAVAGAAGFAAYSAYQRSECDREDREAKEEMDKQRREAEEWREREIEKEGINSANRADAGHGMSEMKKSKLVCDIMGAIAKMLQSKAGARASLDLPRRSRLRRLTASRSPTRRQPTQARQITWSRSFGTRL